MAPPPAPLGEGRALSCSLRPRFRRRYRSGRWRRSGSRWSGSCHLGSRWSGSRWSSRHSGSRRSGSRWSGSRWSGSRHSGSRCSGSRHLCTRCSGSRHPGMRHPGSRRSGSRRSDARQGQPGTQRLSPIHLEALWGFRQFLAMGAAGEGAREARELGGLSVPKAGGLPTRPATPWPAGRCCAAPRCRP